MPAQMVQGKQAPAGPQYSGNYGFGSAAESSAIPEQERQWYVSNKFGDPYEVDKPQETLNPLGMALSGRKESAGSYKGVTPEARYLYQQSSIPKTVYLQERAPSRASSALGVPANTRWAGKSLTINPVAT